MKFFKRLISLKRMRMMQKKANVIRRRIAESLNVMQKRRELIQNSEWCSLL